MPVPEPDHYASLTFEGVVLTVKPVGPSLGEHEGAVMANLVKEHLEEAAASVRHIVLDFADVSYINSAALGSCVVINNHAKGVGADAILLHMSKEIAGVFKMCRFDRIFKIAPNEKKLAKLLR